MANDIVQHPEVPTEKVLKNILRDTVMSIEKNKNQVFDIYENAKSEVDNIKRELDEIRLVTNQTIAHVDELVKLEQREKQNLVRVSSNFADYSEERIKASYEAVKNVQVELGVAKEKESQLRARRDTMEIRLRNLQKTLQVAERLAVRIGSVLGYLSSQISDVVARMEIASKNKFLGVQIIKAQEEERYRISRELHDGPAQDIANLIYQSSICERMIDIDSEEAKRGLQELRHQIRGCLTDVRQIIFDMRPMSLDDLGLVPALQQLIAKLHDRGVLEASLNVEGDEAALKNHAEVTIFRIVQEALNNVDHHSGTKKARVRLHFSETQLTVLVADEGKGFDMESNPEDDDENGGEGHFGLLGMEERAHLIGAELKVISAVGKGTRVHLSVPLENLEKTDASV